ncbi:MAG: hypothetical protein Q8P92_00675 [Candidatus Daviesbacteria bacterium]|nr:hypothetical protein [Candidatus Daviesbacteria bacterium]
MAKMLAKLKTEYVLEFIFFLIILIFTIRPVENFDFWFHAKNGEFILQTKSLPFSDQFSHTAYGQSAVPYEWLFQVVIYLIYTIFGNIGVQALVVSSTLTYAFIFRQILKEIFQISFIPRILLVGTLAIIGYDFWVERPQISAYVIFMVVLYLILKRVFLGKNFLMLTIPLFFIWTNLHASMIVGLYLFFAFAVLALIKKDIKLAKDLALFGTINTIITLLPPLGIKTYELLYLFFEKRQFITVVIGEWVPLYELGIRYYIYLIIIILALLSLSLSVILSLRKKQAKLKWPILDYLPFIPLGLFVIWGVRQTQFSMPVILLSLVPTIRLIQNRLTILTNKFFIILITAIILITFIFFLYIYREEATGILRLYPKQAIPFIQNNLKGKMFNEYEMGGYIMYRLGPEFKTFIDGRTDMFLPKVLPEYDELFNNEYTDERFKEKFDYLIEEYEVSFAIITVEKFTPIRRLARLLRNDPQWNLVFFDDTTEIYVKNDGLNEDVIKNFSFQAATPFGKKLYKENQRDEARKEYQRMQSIAPSAVSLNTLGFMLLEEKKFDEAKTLFIQALAITPYSAAPKMNLAELSVKYGDLNQAIGLYRQAIRDEPERGLAYLRLGQLIIQSGGSENEAREIWQKGLSATPDENILKQIREALSK